jgi:hypothetical protein
MSACSAPDLRLVRNPDGSPRFYPPDEHPAGARLRTALAQLREIESRTVRAPAFRHDPVEEAIDWCERQLAILETGENWAKRAYIAAQQGR